MNRCLQLALLGAGNVAPNPMVGSVLVYKDRIIGEGYHQQYGQAHAEVNCINNVPKLLRHQINQSTIYVSLEPCAHFGKTPPCADLIVANKIPRVVIGCTDSFDQVNGKGIQQLVNAGIQVTTGVLETAARKLNERFFTFHQKQRPFVILKWAQSNNGKIANADYSALAISNDFSNRLVHKWRSETAAIMVGANTALHDNPALSTRLWKGKNPLRILLDKNLDVPDTHNILADGNASIIFNLLKEGGVGAVTYVKLQAGKPLLPQVLKQLYLLNVQSVLVEGGASLLQSFLATDDWDEMRIITNTGLTIGEGVPAPIPENHGLVHTALYLADTIQYFQPSSNCNS